jgi:hypothetical protein
MTSALSKLAQQENENELVLSELKLLGDDSSVYKLVGPALIKQDLDEARSNVEKRLQFIGDEMYKVNLVSNFGLRRFSEMIVFHHRKRTQNHILDIDKKSEEKREKIVQLQAAHQGKK